MRRVKRQAPAPRERNSPLTLLLAVVAGLALAGATCKRGPRGSSGRPGESADAAANGSGYGLGRASGNVKAEGEKTYPSGTGPGPSGNPRNNAGTTPDDAAVPAPPGTPK
jgi:hypothetical protein